MFQAKEKNTKVRSDIYKTKTKRTHTHFPAHSISCCVCFSELLKRQKTKSQEKRKERERERAVLPSVSSQTSPVSIFLSPVSSFSSADLANGPIELLFLCSLSFDSLSPHRFLFIPLPLVSFFLFRLLLFHSECFLFCCGKASFFPHCPTLFSL